MPEGEPQVGLVDVLDRNSDLRGRTRARVRAGGHGLSRPAGQAPLRLGEGCAELSGASILTHGLGFPLTGLSWRPRRPCRAGGAWLRAPSVPREHRRPCRTPGPSSACQQGRRPSPPPEPPPRGAAATPAASPVLPRLGSRGLCSPEKPAVRGRPLQQLGPAVRRSEGRSRGGGSPHPTSAPAPRGRYRPSPSPSTAGAAAGSRRRSGTRSPACPPRRGKSHSAEGAAAAGALRGRVARGAEDVCVPCYPRAAPQQSSPPPQAALPCPRLGSPGLSPPAQTPLYNSPAHGGTFLPLSPPSQAQRGTKGFPVPIPVPSASSRPGAASEGSQQGTRSPPGHGHGRYWGWRRRWGLPPPRPAQPSRTPSSSHPCSQGPGESRV